MAAENKTMKMNKLIENLALHKESLVFLLVLIGCSLHKYTPFEKAAISKVQDELENIGLYGWEVTVTGPPVEGEFVRKHTIFRLWSQTFPAFTRYVAVGPDTIPHLLWKIEEFNKVVEEESLDIKSTKEVVGLIKLFITVSYQGHWPYDSIIVLENISDIPSFSSRVKGITRQALLSYAIRLQGELSPPLDSIEKEIIILKLKSIRDLTEHFVPQLEEIVHSPEVTEQPSGFVVTFYTWESFLGIVKRWKTEVKPNGVLKILRVTEIAIGVGNYTPYIR